MRGRSGTTGMWRRLAAAAAVWLVAAAVAWPAAADIYKYEAEDGSVLITTSPRKGMKLIEVLRDGDGGDGGGGGGKHEASRREATSKRRAALARARPRTLEGGGTTQAPAQPYDPSVPRESRYDDIIQEASRTYRIPAAFIKGVIKVESDFNPYVVSRTGAMGLMQLMPGTARYLGVEDPFDPRQNIFGGTKLLRMLTNKYNGDINLLLSAYNAGEGAVARYDGIPYTATREYVRKVYDNYKRFQQEEQARAAGAPQGRP